ncbi:uncharacterized protein FFM5_15327 [Fusarium fujikuroi]
MTQLD